MQGRVNPIIPEMLFIMGSVQFSLDFNLCVVKCSECGALKVSPSSCCDPQVMKKSVIGPDFEKKDAVPPYSESKQALKLKHRVSFAE